MDEPRISFGEWLTRRRKSLNLTRDALAKRVPCSVSTLRRLESDDLRASPSLAEALARALNLPEGQRAVFIAFARGERADLPVEHPLPAGGGAPPDTLPAALTPLVGRKREIAAISETLHKPGVRLLTLTGPPGTGKTRLSLAVAQKLARSFRDGAYFIALAPVADPKSVPAAIAQALGLKESRVGILPALTEFLRDKRLLLVLDNFEHLIPAAPLVTELLSAAPQVKALVTSREILHLYGEHEFPVPPLELLDVSRLPSSQSLSFYSRYSSIQFFKERARAAKPDFRLTGENVADVARICAWLDGLPLAIEIAAAQVKWRAPNQLYAQLRDRLKTLTGGPRDLSPRQQSLRGAMDWSFDLLNETEKRLFSLLGIFSDGFTEEAVGAARGLVFDSAHEKNQIEILKTKVRSLVEKSLLRHELAPDGSARYAMLETMRDYARDQLQARGEMERAQAWHCEYYLNLAKIIRPNLIQGGEQAQWLALAEREHNNLRAALSWAIASGRVSTAMELGWALHPFWSARSFVSEQRGWLEKILALDPAPTKMRADLLKYASDIASSQGDYEKARDLEEEGLTISKILGDEAGVYYSMDGLARLAGMQGDYAQAAELLEQALRYWRKVNDTVRLTTTLNNLAIATLRLGNHERAKQLYEEAMEVTKSVGNLSSFSHALYGLAELHADLKEYALAVQLLRESISVRYQLGDVKGLAFSLDALAMSLYGVGQPALATQMEGACRKIFRELGVVTPLATRAEYENFLAELRAALGDSAFETEWARGQAMSQDQAVSLALDDAQESTERSIR
ncbi:MAG: tetratricopeptide repeat protein [Chloroflexi bacterium]|nr:tetratricopeptide repeat protein [Chloroflexota bacterium]